MKKLIFLFITACIISCSSTKMNDNDCGKYRADNPVIVMRKMSGYGKVPSFEISIRGDGVVTFLGRRHVDKIGKYETRISKEDIHNLVCAFQTADFFNLDDEYTDRVRDLPEIFITFTCGDKIKTVRDHYRAPEELKQLEAEIEKIIGVEGWKEIK